MHSAIFQISTKPISEFEFITPENLYKDSYDFCDYIGDEYDKQSRINAIFYLQELFKDIFDIEEHHLVYKGLGTFINDWNKYIRSLSNELEDNAEHWFNIYKIKNATEDTHLHCYYRFYIEEWNEWPGPASSLIEFARNKLKPGDKLYIGSVIDYHF